VSDSPGATSRPPGALTFDQVRAARELLRKIVPVSRVLPAVFGGAPARGRVFLKLESEGPTSSFKVRGAYHAVHQRRQRGPMAGVVTSSTGNHGAATAYAARQLGLPARVYLPEHPNPAKRARIAEQGAEIIEAGTFLEASREHAARFAQESGWYNLVDGVEPEMLPGTATIACEVLEQVPDADVLFVPVGDSALIRGVAFAAKQLRPGVRIIGVQAERAPAYALSFRAGRAVSTETSDTIADGLAARHASEENVREIAALVDEFVLVSEEEMLRAVRHLVLEEHVVTEPAGAATTAAFVKTREAYAGRTVVLLVTGANIPEGLLRRALAVC
jgi:threonine dehydratase